LIRTSRAATAAGSSMKNCEITFNESTVFSAYLYF